MYVQCKQIYVRLQPASTRFNRAEHITAQPHTKYRPKSTEYQHGNPLAFVRSIRMNRTEMRERVQSILLFGIAHTTDAVNVTPRFFVVVVNDITYSINIYILQFAFFAYQHCACHCVCTGMIHTRSAHGIQRFKKRIYVYCLFPIKSRLKIMLKQIPHVGFYLPGEEIFIDNIL